VASRAFFSTVARYLPSDGRHPGAAVADELEADRAGGPS
jgi:hypothetical protein